MCKKIINQWRDLKLDFFLTLGLFKAKSYVSVKKNRLKPFENFKIVVECILFCSYGKVSRLNFGYLTIERSATELRSW